MASPQQLMQYFVSVWIARAIYEVARLGVADALKDGPKSSEELARLTEAHPKALHRTLRALASVGIFTEQPGSPQLFGLSELGYLLRSDVPESMRAGILVTASDAYWNAWGNMGTSLKTNESAFQHVHGAPFYVWLGQHDEMASLFDRYMIGLLNMFAPAIIDAYDFSEFNKVVDLGGGAGMFLSMILERYPKLQGVLYDQAYAIEDAREVVRSKGLQDRCELITGDFKESVPEGGDLYILKDCIHGWNDELALLILKQIRRAMRPGSKFIVIEGIIPSGPEPAFAKLFDLEMMVIPGGQERTESEYRTLYEAAGFRLSRIIPTKAEIKVIIEGVPV